MTMERVRPQHEQDETQPHWLVALAREQPGLTALLLMSLVGLGVSIYLTIVHYDSKVSLLCTTGGVVNCQSVTTSAYSVIPGTTIPITIPGMLWFIALGALAGVGLWTAAHSQPEPARLRLAALLWTIAGMVFVLYLVYAEIVKVQRICEWCTVVHLLTLASFLVALTRWQRRDEPVLPPQRRAPARPPTAPTHSAAPAHPAAPAISRRTRRTLNHRQPNVR